MTITRSYFRKEKLPRVSGNTFCLLLYLRLSTKTLTSISLINFPKRKAERETRVVHKIKEL